MFRRLSKERAQSTLEYAVLIGVIVAGLIAMQVYLKRGFQGKLREGADSMGEQFSPGYTNYSYSTNSFTNSLEVLANEVTTTTLRTQQTNRIGNEQVSTSNQEFWWK